MANEYDSQGQDEYQRRAGGEPQGGGPLEPDRGTLVLVMGILGLLVCVVCGILAWVWGSADLKKMDAGTMDPAGRGNTQVGKVLGIVSVVLNILAIVGFVLFFVLAVGSAVSAQQGQ